MPIRQIAYFVPDVRRAAARHHRDFGSGPFFVADTIKLRSCTYRGGESALDHSAAYGQWGSLMVEFVQQNNPGPSAFHDMYPPLSGREGVHHVAVFVENIRAAIALYEARGYACALYAEMVSGFAFAMMDAVPVLGHMIELYQPEPALLAFYQMVADAAKTFDGSGLIRPISLD